MKKILILVLALFLLIAAGCSVKEAGETEKIPKGMEIVIPPSEPSAPSEEAMPESAEMEEEKAIIANETMAEEKPAELEETLCDESATLGYLSCNYRNGDILLEIKNTGRTDLDGVWYKFYDRDFALIGENSELFGFKLTEIKELSVALANYPNTKYVHIFPVQTNKICANKQLVLMPANSCR